MPARLLACPTCRPSSPRRESFANAFVTTPLCCPSRASILRGQYAHSHGVLSNGGDNGGFPAFYRLGDEESTVATWLQDAGYRTALVGKYLNRYPKEASESHVPPGWDEWTAFASSDEDEEVVLQRLRPQRGRRYRLLWAAAIRILDRRAHRQGDRFHRSHGRLGRPFFLYIAPYAPHGPSTPASRHTEAFADVQAAHPVIWRG